MDRILFGQEDGDFFSFLFFRKADMEGIVKNPLLLHWGESRWRNSHKVA